MRKIFLTIIFIIILTSCAQKQTQLFIFKRYNPETDNWDYYKTDLYAPSHIEKINIIPCSDNKNQPIWSPNGKYYGCSNPPVIRDIHNTITADLKNYPEWGIWDWSPESQYVSIINNSSSGYPPFAPYDFSIMKYDGTELIHLNKEPPATILYGEWSPDGKFIAHVMYREKEFAYLIIYQSTGKEVARFDLLKLMNTYFEDIKWSPNSKKLAFFTKDNNITILDIESGKLTTITADKSVCVINIFDWAPNSESILFNGVNNCRESWPMEDAMFRAYSINIDGSGLKPLTEKGYRISNDWRPYYGTTTPSLHWTLDGKSIIIDGYEYAGEGIFLMDSDGNNPKRLVDNGYFVRWIMP